MGQGEEKGERLKMGEREREMENRGVGFREGCVLVCVCMCVSLLPPPHTLGDYRGPGRAAVRRPVRDPGTTPPVNPMLGSAPGVPCRGG